MKSVAKVVEEKIQRLPRGMVITYDTFGNLAVTERKAVAQALSRLAKRGAIKKLCRGRYYKPEQGRYGALPLSEQEQLRGALENGYISGAEAFNRLGITTQISAEVVIATPGKAYTTRIGNLSVKYVRASVSETPRDVELVMLLDALKQVKKVQDASPDRVVTVVKQRVGGMSRAQVETLTTLVAEYPPRVRAILGAILETSGRKRQSLRLKASLNPLSKYKVGIKNALSNLKEWNLL